MQAGLLAHVKARLELAKIPLCLFIGCAALFGLLMAASPKAFPLASFLVPLGVFLVAAGAASLNNLQEHRLDAMMQRTKNRPLPTGRLSRRQAGWQAVVLFSLGLFAVASGAEDHLPLAATAGAVLLYNGIYTPLKKLSVLAIVPGALCGALPVAIGWLAGGGRTEFMALLLVALFILWQVPHFWLILLAYRPDYAGGILPNILRQLPEKSVRRLLIVWIGALSLVMLLFAAQTFSAFSATAGALRVAVIANALALPALFGYCLHLRREPPYNFLFMALNSSLLLHMVLISAGRLTGG